MLVGAQTSTLACGWAVASVRLRRRSFFEGCLLFGDGHHIARARQAQPGVQPLQIIPAALFGDGPSQPFAHPLRHALARPALALRRGTAERLAQLLLLRAREQGRRAMAGGIAAVDHPRCAFGVVAPGNLPDPIRRVAGALRDFARQLPFAQQPDDLPAAALSGLRCAPVVLFEFLHTQVRS